MRSVKSRPSCSFQFTRSRAGCATSSSPASSVSSIVDGCDAPAVLCAPAVCRPSSVNGTQKSAITTIRIVGRGATVAGVMGWLAQPFSVRGEQRLQPFGAAVLHQSQRQKNPCLLRIQFVGRDEAQLVVVELDIPSDG